MACKHEGGTDPCQKSKSHNCIARTKLYRKKNRTKLKRYAKTVLQHCSKNVGRERGKTTAACERFVQADLSRRGYEVTVPISPTARHDMHVELPSVGWKGVQVKAGSLNLNTGYFRATSNKRGESPIFAIVHLPTMRIDYLSGTEPLPPELQ